MFGFYFERGKKLVKSLCFIKTTPWVGKKLKPRKSSIRLQLKRDNDEHSSHIPAVCEQSMGETAEPEHRLGSQQKKDNWTHHSGLDFRK